MLYLDNDVLAKFARPHPDPVVVQYLQDWHAEPWGISALVAYKFLGFYPQSQRGAKLRELEQDVLNEIFDKQPIRELLNVEIVPTDT